MVLTDSLSDKDEAIGLAGRVREILSRPVGLGAIQIEIGASVGIAFGTDTNPDNLLSDADRALYHAKRNGRGRVELSHVTANRTPQSQSR